MVWQENRSVLYGCAVCSVQRQWLFHVQVPCFGTLLEAGSPHTYLGAEFIHINQVCSSAGQSLQLHLCWSSAWHVT